ncbi:MULTISPECIES: hypothetical protein [Prochlorococcus]|uniref:hypothetical protein n=1 Tax=Prochlorococcus TaxID=1218 RepID=UPI000533AE4F|nr:MULTISPECIES: hypothetical protein [Prochlorococcus]KGG12714.1 hypothetical protein EV05_1932 [Prochlorococcus sp. MIT 0601]
MKDGTSTYQLLARLFASSKALLKGLLRLPRFLLDGPTPYLKEIQLKNEQIASFEYKLETSEAKASERDQCLSELKQVKRKLEQDSKEIVDLREKLEASEAKELEARQTLRNLQERQVRELQNSKEEIAGLKEHLKDKLKQCDDQEVVIKENLQAIKQGNDEISSLKQQLEISQVKEQELTEELEAQVSKGFPDRIREFFTGTARREGSVRKDAYQTLEVLLKIIEELEDVGDALAAGYKEYQTGRRNYSGGAPIAELTNAVSSFNKIWSNTKEEIKPLLDKQGSMKEIPK